MRRPAAIALILAVVLLATTALAVLPVPPLRGRVNDDANLLTARQREQLEQALAAYEAETSNQIALLTVTSLDGEAIEDFSMRVAEQWKLGQKGRDNGVLLLVAKDDRRVRIEVGYGLEGTLTDAESSRIIRDVIVPAFRGGNYFAGIAAGLDAVMQATQGEFKGTGAGVTYRGARQDVSCSELVKLIPMLIIFLILMSTRTGRAILFGMMLSGMFGGRGGRGGGFGGGFSGGGGGFGGGGASGSW